ncbi:hypothetical protein R6258_07720 [Halomonas sp. HP20-15]|uniref:hypothetical protein n=1 Tax=Halomonas sp. HP20-15 TaxID=3085901 RepID=UPI0029819937|nr:hypothetical protein [Halomonas sp. HP20-15]MDW5376807.1 hypothetical protein [Halomonas sp. HP20-15]
MRIPSYQRFQIAAIVDQCIDVTNAGTYSASFRYGASNHIDVITRRMNPTGDSDDVQHHWARVGSPDLSAKLTEITKHLDRLLAASQERLQ